MGAEPEPGDVVIAVSVSCNKSQPGLDGKRDRVVRISYRPSGGAPLKKGEAIGPPKKKEGAFPEPGDPSKDGPTSGATVDDDGIVWIDTQVYGQPPGGGLGDDSEDVTSRISEAVQAAIAEGKISADDISVEHNGLSDTKPEEGDCPYGKPQDKGEGLGRIVLKKPTHVDAAADDSKIRLSIIVIEDATTAKNPVSVQIIPESVPDKMPDERGPKGGWVSPQGADKTEKRRTDPDLTIGDRQKPLVPEALRKDIKWKRPPVKKRKFSWIDDPGLFIKNSAVHPWPSDADESQPSASSTVSVYGRGDTVVEHVDNCDDGAEQLQSIALALSSCGCGVAEGLGDLLVSMPGGMPTDCGPSGFTIDVPPNWRVIMGFADLSSDLQGPAGDQVSIPGYGSRPLYEVVPQTQSRPMDGGEHGRYREGAD